MSRAWGSGTSCSVIGAAHRRQGKPCQDASLSCQLGSGAQQLQLLAVSDGHGGSRYWLSEVGSAQACLAAQAAVEEALRGHPLSNREQWLRQLQLELPEAIQQRWLEAVHRDWQERPDSETTPFSSSVYGCTLGLVLMAPQWWGCTGIGDWDLVGISSPGEASLLSEESLQGGAAEATTSLCQADVLGAWRERAQLHGLGDGPAPLGLLLSTDGIRKSCATDADFLQLCSQLMELESGTPLEQALMEITAQGSGDDVSVAMVQRSGQHSGQRTGQHSSSSLGLGRLGPVALALGIAAAGAGGWWWLQQRRPAPSPIEREVAQLCGAPERINASLSQRREQFLQLLRQPQAGKALLQEPERDPLGALIAGSMGGSASLQACLPLKQALDAHWQTARKTPVTTPPSPQVPARP